jgi:hypothetical protein
MRSSTISNEPENFRRSRDLSRWEQEPRSLEPPFPMETRRTRFIARAENSQLSLIMAGVLLLNLDHF